MGIDIQDDQGRHEVGMVENTIKTPLGLGQEGCLFESVFHINKVTNYKFYNFHNLDHRVSACYFSKKFFFVDFDFLKPTL